MVDLQRIWDEVLKTRSEIDRKTKSITFWQNELIAKKTEEARLKEDIKLKKNVLKNNELELASLETKTIKLNVRRKSVQTEREMKAVDSELEGALSSKSTLEENILAMMEEQETLEGNLHTVSTELVEMEKQVNHDIDELMKERDELKILSIEKEEKFNCMSDELPPALKSKFSKLIQSKEGKAIGEVVKEICSVCNFKIPASLALQSARDDTISNCTNCGRFIFSK